MRELLLLAIVAVLCSISVVKPRIGLYAYICFALIRPDSMVFASGRYQFSWYLAVATLLGSIRFAGSGIRILRNPFSMALLCLLTVFYISSLTALNPALSIEPMQLQARVVLMALLQVVLIQTPEQIRTLLLTMGLSLGAVALKFGLFALARGGAVLTEGYAGFLADNNNLALALVMTLGLCWYLKDLIAGKWSRTAVFVAVAMSAVTVIMTHSRGGLVSLVVIVPIIAWRSKHRLAVIAIFVCIIGGAIYLVRESYFQRMSTLTAPLEEGSARTRIALSKGGLRMAADHPLLGVGFGSENERQIIGQYLNEGEGTGLYLHNTYLQVLVDSGVFAGLLYVGLLIGTILWLGRSARMARLNQPEWEPVPLAIRTALIAYAVGSYFLSRVIFDYTYMLLMSAAAWSVIERDLAYLTIEAVPEGSSETSLSETRILQN